MTDKSVLIWVHEVLGVGTLTDKPRKGLRKNGTKYLMQYRWRCTFRDAYYVCLLIWPWSHTKLPKIQQIIQHYADKKVMNDNVVDLLEYKKFLFFSLNLLIKLFKSSETSLTTAKSTLIFFPIEEGSISTCIFLD